MERCIGIDLPRADVTGNTRLLYNAVSPYAERTVAVNPIASLTLTRDSIVKLRTPLKTLASVVRGRRILYWPLKNKPVFRRLPQLRTCGGSDGMNRNTTATLRSAWLRASSEAMNLGVHKTS